MFTLQIPSTALQNKHKWFTLVAFDQKRRTTCEVRAEQERCLSGLKSTPGKCVYASKRTEGSNPSLSDILKNNFCYFLKYQKMVLNPSRGFG